MMDVNIDATELIQEIQRRNPLLVELAMQTIRAWKLEQALIAKDEEPHLQAVDGE